MQLNRAALAMGLLVGLAALPARAAGQLRTEIVPSIGAVRYGEGTSVAVSPAIALRQSISPGMFVSGELRYVPAKIEFGGCLAVEGICDPTEDIRVSYGFVGLGITTPGDGTRPYGGLGVGAVRRGSLTSQSFMIQLGVLIPIGHRVAFDARFHNSWDDTSVEFVATPGFSIGGAYRVR